MSNVPKANIALAAIVALLICFGCSAEGSSGPEAGSDQTRGDTGSDAVLAGGHDLRDTGTTRSGLETSCGKPEYPEGQEGWQVLCNGERVGQLLSVWGSSPDDVYIVGGRSTTEKRPGKTRVFHWNGSTLEALETPGRERAWWVFGTDEDHVYVFGENGLGLKRIDGGEFETFETKTEQTIFGAWGPSPDRVYFVSGDFRDASAQGKIHVLTPSGVELVKDDDVTDFEGKALFKVWGAGADDVLVSGDKGAMFHFDGTDWTRMKTPDDSTRILTVSGRAGDDVWGVGGGSQGVAWHYDGDKWTDASPKRGVPGLMGVHTSDSTPVVVSGINGFLATVGTNGFQSEGHFTNYPLHGVWQDGRGGAWAVGGNIMEPGGPANGVILRRPPVENCPDNAIRKPGYHHLDFQGRGGQRRPDGSYPMFDVPRGDIHPDLVHGEHFTTGKGTYTEFSIPLCADITDDVGFRITNNEDPGVDALYQLFITRGDQEFLVAESLDTVPGSQGYIPFNRSSLPDDIEQTIAQTDTHPTKEEYNWMDFSNASDFKEAPRDILARPGDRLVFRATNLSEKTYGLMVWFPQNGLHYQSFVEVRVPETPGGIAGQPDDPPPEPGPCATEGPDKFVELGRDENGFAAFPPREVEVERGLQGALMLRLAVRGKGFSGGKPDDPLASENPRLLLRMALNAYPSDGGQLIVDSSSQRGFEKKGDELELSNVRPVVLQGTVSQSMLVGEKVYAEVKLVDAKSGETLCQKSSFTAVSP